MFRSASLLFLLSFAFAVHSQEMPCSATVETVAQHIGGSVVFCGTPTAVHASKNPDGPLFMDFGGRYPDAPFTVVIFGDVAGKDRDTLVKRYSGKTLHVRGEVKSYKGRTEMVLKSLDDIQAE